MEYQYNAEAVFLNLFIWLILIYKYGKSARKPWISAKPVLFSLGVIIYCTFAFSEADTYHYHRIYDQMVMYHQRIHVEDFYYWLVNVLPHNYYLWRFVIWGAAFVLIWKCFKRYKLDYRVLCFVFPMILLQQFAITRGSLGIALFLLSMSYFLKPTRNWISSCLLGGTGCIVALFLHRSLPLFMAIFLLSFIPLKKSGFWILLLAFPIIRFLALPLVFNILGSTTIFSSDTVDFATRYLEAKQTTANINGIIRNCVDYIPRFLIFYVLIKNYLFKKNTDAPHSIIILFRYSFFLFYIALLFLGQSTSAFVTSRTIHMMCFPLTIVLSYYLSTKQSHSGVTVLALLLFLLSDFYSFAYSIYSWR